MPIFDSDGKKFLGEGVSITTAPSDLAVDVAALVSNHEQEINRGRFSSLKSHWFTLRAKCGFPTSIRHEFTLTDTNSDGVCSVRMVGAVPFVVKSANGSVKLKSAAADMSENICLPSGQYIMEIAYVK